MKRLTISPKFELPTTNNSNIPTELDIEKVYEITENENSEAVYCTIHNIHTTEDGKTLIVPNIRFTETGFKSNKNYEEGYALENISSITPKYLLHKTVKNTSPLDPDTTIEITIINYRTKTPYRILVDSESLVCLSIRETDPKTKIQSSQSIYGYIRDIVGSRLKITALCNKNKVFYTKDMEIESSNVRGIFDTTFTFNQYKTEAEMAAEKAAKAAEKAAEMKTEE